VKDLIPPGSAADADAATLEGAAPTRGPWTFVKWDEPSEEALIEMGRGFDGRNLPLYTTWVRSGSPANARLMVAAPALLEALTELLDACEADNGVPDAGDDDDESVSASMPGKGGAITESVLTFGKMRRARAAIAKATGEAT
jgi:hypothetical protein